MFKKPLIYNFCFFIIAVIIIITPFSQVRAESFPKVYITQDQNYVYLAEMSKGKVYVFNNTDNLNELGLVKVFNTGNGPSHLLRYKNYLLVALSQTREIKVINIDNLTEVGSIQTPAFPYQLGYFNIGSSDKIFVTPAGDQWEYVFLINIDSNNILNSSGQIINSLGESFYARTDLLIDNSGKFAYLSPEGLSPANITKLDLNDVNNIKEVDESSHGKIGSFSTQLIFNNDSSKIFTVRHDTSFYIVNTSDLTTQSMVPMDRFPSSIALTTDKIFVGRDSFNDRPDINIYYRSNNVFYKSCSFTDMQSGEKMEDAGLSSGKFIYAVTNQKLYLINSDCSAIIPIYDLVNEKSTRKLPDLTIPSQGSTPFYIVKSNRKNLSGVNQDFIDIYAWVQNIGLAESGPFDVKFFSKQINDSSYTQYNPSYYDYASLNPDKWNLIRHTLVYDSEPIKNYSGSFEFVVKLDTKEKVAETDESNNSKTLILNAALINKDCSLYNLANTNNYYIFYNGQFRKFLNSDTMMTYGFDLNEVLGIDYAPEQLGIDIVSLESDLMAKCGTMKCGNNYIDFGEACDGTNLDNQTCVSKGFSDGTLSCASDCKSFDTSACTKSAPVTETIDCVKPLSNYSYLKGYTSNDTLINLSKNQNYGNNADKLSSLVDQIIAKYGNQEFSLPNTYTPLIGQCTWMEHWETKNCYIYSYKEGKKVSEYTDQSCNDVASGKAKMIKAIKDGYCCLSPINCSATLNNYNYLSGFGSTDTIESMTGNDTKLNSLVDQVIEKFGYGEFDTPNTYTPLIGQCTWMEHWDTKNCYIYSYKEGKKVSAYTDQSCNDVVASKAKMIKAINDGYCCATKAAAQSGNTCSDTDGGTSLDKLGVVTVKNSAGTLIESKNDYCSDQSSLVEYYCASNSIANSYNNCPNGCEAGVCKAGLMDKQSSLCGNGTQEGLEQCDGVLSFKDCRYKGYKGGEIKCTNCKLDLSGCYNDLSEAKQTTNCQDSDGKDYYKLGKISVANDTIVYDSCLKDHIGQAQYGNDIKQDDHRVLEAVCEVSSDGKLPYKLVSYDCPGGCQQGACISNNIDFGDNKAKSSGTTKAVEKPKYNLTDEAKYIVKSGQSAAGLDKLINDNGQKKNVPAQKTNMTKYTSPLNREYGPYKTKYLYAINNFITYGTRSTKSLTSAERYQLVADWAEYNEDLPTSVGEWQEILEMNIDDAPSKDGQVLGIKIFYQGADLFKELAK